LLNKNPLSIIQYEKQGLPLLIRCGQRGGYNSKIFNIFPSISCPKPLTTWTYSILLKNSIKTII